MNLPDDKIGTYAADAEQLDGEQHMVKAMRRAVLAAAHITAATLVVGSDGTGTTGP